MLKLVSTILCIIVFAALISLSFFEILKKSKNSGFKLTQESGDFNFISKTNFFDYNVYTFYILTDDEIEEKKIIVYTSNLSMKNSVDLEINTNSSKNSYNFDFNQNKWGVYDENYKNKIIINLNNETKIKKIKEE